MTCRDEILTCANRIVSKKRINEFTLQEIIDSMQTTGTKYKENTIRTHVTSRMCANAPKHHAVKFKDLGRVDHGVYKLNIKEEEKIVPAPSEFEKGCHEFQMHEQRDAMYKTATFLVNHFWGKPLEMADSLGVLLLTWNQAFYRYGLFDFDILEECISNNQTLLNYFRLRDILNYSNNDDDSIMYLFNEFLSALKISDGKKAGTRSPVGVSKALHLLAPGFFPLWDDKIARAYGCYYRPKPERKYLVFIGMMKQIAEKLQSSVDAKTHNKTLLKLIDEYNYAKYTKHWV